MKAAVVVPSFARPSLLARCLEALAAQRRLPDEVVVAVRTGDSETLAAVDEAAARLRLAIRTVTVRGTGHLQPVAAGAAATSSDVVCFVDDDAVPWPDWLNALLRHYADPTVGGAGGLVSQPGPGERRPAGRVGSITSSGRFDTLATERVPTAWGAREVDSLRGTNMSFRGELVRAFPWDERVNRGAATDYEVDLGAWVRRRGYRLIYDPDAIVTHTLGPRPEIGREATSARIADYSHNLVYVSGKALPTWRAALAVTGAFAIGSRGSYGLVTAAADTLRGRPPSWRRQVAPALRGKVDGLRSLRDLRRNGPLPLADL